MGKSTLVDKLVNVSAVTGLGLTTLSLCSIVIGDYVEDEKSIYYLFAGAGMFGLGSTFLFGSYVLRNYKRN